MDMLRRFSLIYHFSERLIPLRALLPCQIRAMSKNVPALYNALETYDLIMLLGSLWLSCKESGSYSQQTMSLKCLAKSVGTNPFQMFSVRVKMPRSYLFISSSDLIRELLEDRQ